MDKNKSTMYTKKTFTDATYLIDQLEFFRVNLAGLKKVSDFKKYGIISAPYYYKIKQRKQSISFETSCYIALSFFGVFLLRGPNLLDSIHKEYANKSTEDILKKIADAYIVCFRMRSPSNHPLSIPLSSKQKVTVDKKVLEVLSNHDRKLGRSKKIG